MSWSLNELLAHIVNAEQKGDYAARNYWVALALVAAQRRHMTTGFAYDDREDPDFDGFRIIAYIELPGVGQVSWHLPEYPIPYDGHTTEEKYDRIRQFIGMEK